MKEMRRDAKNEEKEDEKALEEWLVRGEEGRYCITEWAETSPCSSDFPAIAVVEKYLCSICSP